MSSIIFDFDGTIANSFDFVADFLAKGTADYPLTAAKRHELHGMSMYAIARHLGHSRWRLPALFYRGRRQMHGDIRHLQPFEGIPEVIRHLHAQGHELFLLSSNNVRNIRTFLHHHDLHTYFLEITGSVGLFSKAPALRRLLKRHAINVDDAYYIGDELRDVEASQAIGLPIIAVTWGFARTAALKDIKPTAIAHKPEDVVDIIDS